MTVLEAQFVDSLELVVKRPFVAVLLHGMWHGAWFWQRLQARLAASGVASYALELRAGHFKTLQSHVDDVTATVCRLPSADRIVFVGHSQGGLICQALLEHAPFRAAVHIEAVVLAASVPLAMQPAETLRAWGWFGSPLVRMLWAMGTVPFLYYSVLGRLWNRSAAHAIFYLPTTEPPVSALQRCVDAQCDGLPTWSHFLRRVPSFALAPDTRVLVLGGERDIVYAPVPLVLRGAHDSRSAPFRLRRDRHTVCRIQGARPRLTRRLCGS